MKLQNAANFCALRPSIHIPTSQHGRKLTVGQSSNTTRISLLLHFQPWTRGNRLRLRGISSKWTAIFPQTHAEEMATPHPPHLTALHPATFQTGTSIIPFHCEKRFQNLHTETWRELGRHRAVITWTTASATRFGRATWRSWRSCPRGLMRIG